MAFTMVPAKAGELNTGTTPNEYTDSTNATDTQPNGIGGYSIINQSTGAAVASVPPDAFAQSTPQATAGVVPLVMNAARLSDGKFRVKLRDSASLKTGSETKPSKKSDRTRCLTRDFLNLPEPPWLAWGEPFYHHSNQDSAPGSGYSDLEENINGGIVGVARRFGDFTYGLSGHFLYSDVNGGSYYNAGYQGFGLTSGAGARFNLGSLSPWVGLSAGWANYSLDQTRISPMVSTSYKSKPEIDPFSANLTASNDFAFGRTTLSPELGFDYVYSDMDDYTEYSSTDPGAANRVQMDGTNSLRSVLGLRAAQTVGKRFSLSVQGAYYHELWDKNATYSMRDVGDLSFKVRGEGMDAGRDWYMAGAGAKFQLNERTDIGVDYETQFGKRYAEHRMSASWQMAF